MEYILKSRVTRLTAEDLGCSEDEFNNFLIDLWVLQKQISETGYNQFTVMPKGEIITVAFLNDGFYKKM